MTTSLPARLVAAIRRATRLIDSASATEDPPNFWTTRVINPPVGADTAVYPASCGARCTGHWSKQNVPAAGRTGLNYPQPMDPNMRIGDSDRDAAVAALRDHHVAGRLTAEEFDDRMAAALAAHTRADLDELFGDLPKDPSSLVVATPIPSKVETSNRRKPLEVVSALTWPAALIFCFATGWQWWWVILIPVFLVPVLTGGHSSHRSRDRRRLEGRSDDSSGSE
ncbi:DUF1707 domain-containing protein [Acidipropionibacterium jensenii]|nr:DUF1707 domain-containing protein [Acidipropionibacterium jensenii]